MASLIEDADCQSVRAAIEQSLDSDSLSDATIKLDIYKGVAERWVQQSTNQVTTLAKTAAILYCAALLAPTLLSITSESDAGVTTQVQAFDYRKRAEELYMQAASMR